MKSVTLLLLIIFSGNFLYLTKAQSIRLVDQKNNPVAEAAVTINEITKGKSALRFSDNQGTVSFDKLSFPLLIQIHHLAFADVIDTLQDANSKPTIQLKSNSVNLKTVSITGSYTPSIAEKSVYKVDVITRDQIDHQASNNLEQLLSQQVNMRIERDQALGSSLLLQGMKGDDIKFLVDGVPLIGRKNGFIDLTQLNLNNVDHIEVIKGSMSVLYGTDAAGGVINLITKNNERDKLNGGINSYYENIGQYNVDGYAGYKFKKSDVLVSGGRNYFDGWSKTDTNSRAFDWKPKEQYFGNIKITHHFNRLRLTLLSDYMHDKVTNKSATIHIVRPYVYAFDEYDNTTRFNNQVYAELPLNSKENMNLTAAYSYYEARKNTYRKDLLDLTQLLTNNAADHDTTRFYSALVRYVFNHAKTESNFNYQLGFDLNNEKGTGKRIDRGQVHSIGDYAAFGSLEYRPITKLVVRPGLRYAYNTSYKAPLIPSLNILFNVTKQVVWRASYGRGFRAPHLKELYLSFHDSNHDIDGNTDLKAENSHHIESSVAWKFLKGKTLIQIEPSAFYNLVNDKITLIQKGADSREYTYVNVENFISKGAEVQAHFTMKNFHVNAGVNYTGVYNTYYGTTGTSDFAWSPGVNGSMDYTFTKTHTTLSAFAKFNGKQPVYLIQSDNSLARYINNDYSLIELNVSQHFFKDRFAITGGVMNLLDVTNVKTYSTSSAHSSGDNEAEVGMGRSVFVKLQLHF